MILERIESRREREQLLQPVVVQNNLNRGQIAFRPFDPLMERVLDPPFSMKELYFIATGSYLLKYIDAYKTAFREAQLEDTVLKKEEHYFLEDSDSRIFLISKVRINNKDDCQALLERGGITTIQPKLIRMRMPSRHRSQTNYLLFIVIDSDAPGLERLSEFCCSCLIGLRTVNPCGHIITALDILCRGFTAKVPAPRLWNIFVHEDHDESEED